MYICSLSAAIAFTQSTQVYAFAQTAYSVVEQLAFFGGSCTIIAQWGIGGLQAPPDRLQLALASALQEREKGSTKV